jgi:hypothetical protein
MKLSIGSGFILAFLVGCLVLLTVWQLEKRRSRRSRMSYCLQVDIFFYILIINSFSRKTDNLTA